MEEKCVKMLKSRIFRQKPVGGTSTMMQWAIGTGTTQIGTGTDWQWITGTGQSGTGTTTSSSPILTYFCTVKSRTRIPMFRDPKK